MGKLIALLRAVNVGGRKIAMAELREACRADGLGDVQTYIASGNLVLRGEVVGMEERLEVLIERRFAIKVPVMIRTPAQWDAYIAANPLPGPAAEEPGRFILAVSKKPVAEGAASALTGRAVNGEAIAHCGDALVFHYREGVGTSKLSPGLIDRLAGSPTTGRNWNTVLKLAQMVRG